MVYLNKPDPKEASVRKITLAFLLVMCLAGCVHTPDRSDCEATRSHANETHQELDRQCQP